MNRTAGWCLLGALAVSGCAVLSGPGGRLPDDRGFDPVVARAPHPKLPNVFRDERATGGGPGADPPLAS